MTLFPLADGYPPGPEGEAIYQQWLAEKDTIYADHQATILEAMTEPSDTEHTSSEDFKGEAGDRLRDAEDQQLDDLTDTEDEAKPEPAADEDAGPHPAEPDNADD